MKKGKGRRVLVADELHLVGKGNVSRVIIYGDNGSGEPSLQLNDSLGKARIQIALNRGGHPVVSLLRTDGKVLAGIGANEENGVGLTVNDQDGNPAILLSTFPDGIRQIDIYDGGGKRIWGCPDGIR